MAYSRGYKTFDAKKESHSHSHSHGHSHSHAGAPLSPGKHEHAQEDVRRVFGSSRNNSGGGNLSGSPRPWAEEHQDSGNNPYSALTFVFTDALITTSCIMLGAAVLSGLDKDITVMLSWIGLFAHALSMTSSEWNSMQIQNEADIHELALEKQHLIQYPIEEEQHLTELLEEWGLSRRTIALMNKDMAGRPDALLRLHGRIELGINCDHPLDNPDTAAVKVFFAFLVGGVVPLIPWTSLFFFDGRRALAASACASFACLTAVGFVNSSLHVSTKLRKTVTQQVLISCVGFSLVFFVTAFFARFTAMSNLHRLLVYVAAVLSAAVFMLLRERTANYY